MFILDFITLAILLLVAPHEAVADSSGFGSPFLDGLRPLRVGAQKFAKIHFVHRAGGKFKDGLCRHAFGTTFGAAADT
jgi:hypothetical protein